MLRLFRKKEEKALVNSAPSSLYSYTRYTYDEEKQKEVLDYFDKLDIKQLSSISNQTESFLLKNLNQGVLKMNECDYGTYYFIEIVKIC